MFNGFDESGGVTRPLTDLVALHQAMKKRLPKEQGHLSPIFSFEKPDAIYKRSGFPPISGRRRINGKTDTGSKTNPSPSLTRVVGKLPHQAF